MSERPVEELLGQLHVLLDIALQMPRSRLPIIRRVADAAGKDGSVGVSGEKHSSVW